MSTLSMHWGPEETMNWIWSSLHGLHLAPIPGSAREDYSSCSIVHLHQKCQKQFHCYPSPLRVFRVKSQPVCYTHSIWVKSELITAHSQFVENGTNLCAICMTFSVSESSGDASLSEPSTRSDNIDFRALAFLWLISKHVSLKFMLKGRVISMQ